MDDLISRKTAIDAVLGVIPYDEYWKEQIEKAVNALPSAQTEIIRCKDCKYHTHMWNCEAWNNSPGFPAVSDDMFCSMAERRIDEHID